MKLKLSRQISEKKIEISNFMKIRPVVAEVFDAYGRTDRHDYANSYFSQFYERA
jgi:hypothetical protein